MSRKKPQWKPAHFYMEVRHQGAIIMSIQSEPFPTAAPLKPEFGATMRLTVGTDRCALATTLVEIARDLLKDDPFLEAQLADTAAGLVLFQMAAGDRFVVTIPDEWPF